MAWDRLKLMVALVVLAFLVLVVLAGRSTAGPARSERRWGRWPWTGPGRLRTSSGLRSGFYQGVAILSVMALTVATSLVRARRRTP